MKNIFRHIFSLGCKEIIGIFRDPLLMFLIIYSFSISVYLGASSMPDSIDNAMIAVVDEDQSPLSKRIIDAFLPPMFHQPARISRSDVDYLMDSGQYTFVVVIGSQFQEKALSGARAEIQVNVDATRMSQAFIGNSYIQAIITSEYAKFMRDTHPDLTYDGSNIVIRNRYNPNLTKSWEGALNELVNNIAMIALILTGAALIREREGCTLEHLLVTPLRPVEIMISKIWSMTLLVMIVTGASLLVVVKGMLAVPVAGSFWLFMLGVMLNLFTMTSMGIFLSCFARDMPQLGILTILVLMPMQILSGGITSQSNMPIFIQWFMRLAPTTYIVKFSKAIVFRGAGMESLWLIFLEMLALGLVFFFIALSRFRKTVAS